MPATTTSDGAAERDAPGAASVPANDGVKITFVMNLKPELSAELCARFAEALPDTRKFPGCRWVNMYRNDEDLHKIIMIEEWDSKEDYQKYLAWRNKDGAMDNFGELLTSPGKPEYWPILLS